MAGSGPTAVLFCHGLTASPWTLREWAQATERGGFTVSVPRLPGHGTTWQELTISDWRDWYARVEREFLLLRRTHRRVFVAGISMGAALALKLAEQHPDDVAGLVLVNPAVQGYPKLALVPFIKYLMPAANGMDSEISLPGGFDHSYPQTPLRTVQSMMQLWSEVRSWLDLVRCPLLVFRSDIDRVVPGSPADVVVRQVSSTEIQLRPLTRSGHVATKDYDADQIFAESLDFFDRHDQ
ncbi:MAG: alpha/beta fold hydrolase [Micropruina sp.]|nr:alpha/beta fold hydrolase [Micropruina sp.]